MTKIIFFFFFFSSTKGNFSDNDLGVCNTLTFYRSHRAYTFITGSRRSRGHIFNPGLWIRINFHPDPDTDTAFKLNPDLVTDPDLHSH
jgi:hypothetical protein